MFATLFGYGGNTDSGAGPASPSPMANVPDSGLDLEYITPQIIAMG